jgi:hypothetical protein
MQKHKHVKYVPRADNIFRESPQAKARRLLTEQAHRDARRLSFNFDVQHDHAPALRSVIEEMGDMIVGRLGGKNTPAQEQAFTAASVALGTLRAAVFPSIAAGDPNYRNAHE